MLVGVRVDTLVIKASQNVSNLEVKGALAFKVENKGEELVTVADFTEIESGASECWPEFNNRFYCHNVPVRFSSKASTEYILLTRWFPDDDCCLPTKK